VVPASLIDSESLVALGSELVSEAPVSGSELLLEGSAVGLRSVGSTVAEVAVESF
jgi:hypothetical protein